MSLFDKLSKMAPGPTPPSPPTAPAPEPAPAMFTKGQSNIAEPDIHSPRDPRARGPGSEKPLLDKLRSVGGVNPPAPARAPAPPPPGPSAPAPGAPPPPPPGPSALAAAPIPPPIPAGNTCPHCRQTFKVLARHKCKGAPAPAPAPEPVAPAAPPRTSTCAFCGETIQGFDPAHFAVCKGAPAPAPTRSTPEPAPLREVSADLSGLTESYPEPVAVPEPAPAPEPEPAPAPEPEPERPAAPEPAPTPSARHIEDLTAGNVTERSALEGYVLFLDVLFEKNEFDANGLKHFSDIVHPLAEMVARENRVPHWGTVEYNRGGSLLASKLEGWIKHVNPVGVILADGSTPECRACKEVLKRYAKVIVQGVR